MASSVNLSRSSLAENLSQLVLDLIRTENLQPGDRLPSLNGLAERFAVATPTMREALRRLEAIGVVEIRHGSGVYVLEGIKRTLLINPHQDGLNERKILELLQARSIIEPQLAELTARWATDEQIQELKRLLKEAEKYLNGNDKALHDANAAFHGGIARFSGNSLLAEVIDTFAKIYSFEQLVIIELYNARSRDHDDHQRIFKAIQDRDPIRARQLMQHHLDEVRLVIETRLGGGEWQTLRVEPKSNQSSN